MKKTAYIIILACIGLIISSCTHKFDEYNTDPNRTEIDNADPTNLLENLIFEGSWAIQQRSWRIHNDLMQYTVECGSSTKMYLYVFTTQEYQTLWNWYQRWAANADHMAELAVNSKDKNAEAIGLTLKALFASLLTDLFGDIPYREAWSIDNNITQPRFDTQRDVYVAMLADLERANSLYDQTKSLQNTQKDLLYGGDIVKWQKFTNSLHLRLLMRLSNRPEMETAKKIQQMVTGASKYPIFTSNDDNAIVRFTGKAPFMNRFGDMTDNSFTTSSRKMGEYLMQIMRTTQDPRLKAYATHPAAADNYYGVESGVIDADEVDKATMNVSTLKSYTSPMWLMTYSEVEFILAEAAQRTMIADDAKTHYDKAITASLRQWVPTTTDNNADTFINGQGSKVTYNGTLERLIEQKYVSLFFMSWESWCDYRRTGYPALPIGRDCDNEKILPTRMNYPQSLITTNRTNYNEQVGKMKLEFPKVSNTSAGGDNMKTPIWWSQRAVEMEKGL